jgi:hypothetical protein
MTVRYIDQHVWFWFYDVLTPLSTYSFYRGGQFYWWGKQEKTNIYSIIDCDFHIFIHRIDILLKSNFI